MDGDGDGVEFAAPAVLLVSEVVLPAFPDFRRFLFVLCFVCFAVVFPMPPSPSAFRLSTVIFYVSAYNAINIVCFCPPRASMFDAASILLCFPTRRCEFHPEVFFVCVPRVSSSLCLRWLSMLMGYWVHVDPRACGGTLRAPLGVLGCLLVGS